MLAPAYKGLVLSVLPTPSSLSARVAKKKSSNIPHISPKCWFLVSICLSVRRAYFYVVEFSVL